MVRCPTELELERFLAEDCAPDDRRRIESHLNGCATCSTWVDEARADDALLPSLRWTETRTTAADPPPEVPRYRLLRRIGRGGMGVVWEAEQERPRRRVAIKVISAGGDDPRRRARFELEAELLARLDHPGIARVFEAGTCATSTGARPYLAMELIEGLPLDAWLREHEPARDERIELVCAIAAAVQHAHAKGVVHRDLKPSNVLVTKYGTPKVLDFGVARPLEREGDERTLEGQVVGSLVAMSPEQARGEVAAVDTRSDVYALGVLLYQALSGARPHEVEGVPIGEALRRIQEDVPAPLSRHDPSLGGDLAVIAAKALSKERDDRYPTAAAFELDLRRHLAHEPILARPPRLAYIATRFVRRNPALSGLALALVLALVGGIVVSGVLLGRSWRAEEQAEDDRRAAVAQATRMEAVRDLLFEVLLTASPRQRTTDAEPTVREAIEIADERLEDKTPEDPLVEALYRHVIGRVWTELGDHELAQRQLDRALALLEEYGTERELRDLAYVLRSLADLAWVRQRYDEVLTLTTRFRELDDRLGRPDPVASANQINLNGLVMLFTGDAEGAVPVLREAIEANQRAQGPDAPDVGIGWKNLAIAHARRGDSEAAEAALAKALVILEASAGSAHPEVASTINLRSQLRERMGDAEGFEADLRKALELYERRLDPDHPQLALPLLRLGKLELGHDRPELALEPLRRAHAIYLGQGQAESIVEAGTHLARALARTGAVVEGRVLLDDLEQALGHETPADDPRRATLAQIRAELGGG